jgi:hypothetical protein
VGTVPVTEVWAAVLLLGTCAAAGYAVLAVAGERPLTLADLGVAAVLGLSVLMPLVLVEQSTGRGPLAVALLLSGVALWRTPRARFARGSWTTPWLLATCALAVAWVAGARDLTVGPEGWRLKAGFDVVDRVFYALVAEETLTSPPWRLQNPTFAGTPLAYSLYPAAATVFLHTYGGVDVLRAALVVLPPVSFLVAALCVAALLQRLVPGQPLAVAAGVVLVLFGGDLSLLVPPPPVLPLERVRTFFPFHSFGAQSLHYNPWMLGLPVLCVGLALGRDALRGGTRGDRAVAALALATLWQVKVFAWVVAVGGLVLGALWRRDRGLFLLAVWTCAFSLPLVALTWASGAESPGFRLVPLHHVYASVEANPALARLGRDVEGPGGAVRFPLAVVVVSLAYASGALGLRLIGLRELGRRARADPTWAWLGCSIGLGLVLGHLLVGEAVPVDGIQFAQAAMFLAWLPAAVALSTWAAAGTGVRVGVAALVCALATLPPLHYLAVRRWPDHLTRPGAVDRVSVTLDPAEVEACAALARFPRGERLGFPAFATADGGVRALLVAALSGRRLAAAATAYSVPADVVRERNELLRRVWQADGTAAMEAVQRLQLDWLWESPEAPIAFRSARLRLAYENAEVRLWRVLPMPSPGANVHPGAARISP